MACYPNLELCGKHDRREQDRINKNWNLLPTQTVNRLPNEANSEKRGSLDLSD